jgi:hypothetical protein
MAQVFVLTLALFLLKAGPTTSIPTQKLIKPAPSERMVCRFPKIGGLIECWLE